jgi:ubiquitin-like 1-activating enzyme E1 B
MSEKASHHPSRNLSLIYGESLLTRIAQANLLIVGVGGIGCELLKLLSKSGFRKFTILDLDTIEETNLNRQFFFRKGDIGGYKAQIGKERILMIDPEL